MSRRQNQLGKHGQDIAAIALRTRGVLLVEAISTHALYIPHPSAKGYFRVVWDTPASGDHRGVMPDGTSVLAETKNIADHNLRYSNLRPHQPERLTAHSEIAISLLVWVHSPEVFVMSWPIHGFQRGASIRPDEASDLDRATREWLEKNFQ